MTLTPVSDYGFDDNKKFYNDLLHLFLSGTIICRLHRYAFTQRMHSEWFFSNTFPGNLTLSYQVVLKFFHQFLQECNAFIRCHIAGAMHKSFPILPLEKPDPLNPGKSCFPVQNILSLHLKFIIYHSSFIIHHSPQKNY